ncbi:MAG: DUF4442 domain-containing protein [Gammaproteobacteria bacterium]|nr:DUF4442 domain-containing protein [Gammaproteobacteria bacterium]MBL7000051.1 DUF4442 domain-containing protein [Gammaproteobacteria bacterium]
MPESIGPLLRQRWQRLSALPFGRWLFSRMVGFFAPYSGSIGANVVSLQLGHGVVTLQERRKVSNHLHSVHAIALVNLAEMVTGLTLLNSLPDETRAILSAIQMFYHKKARGLLTASCHCVIPLDNHEQILEISADIKDEHGDVVATAVASWLIGPEKSAADMISPQ